ncbi:MAG: ammonium transporter [Candidatus Eremiobacteraeota bacterium]|nr:ammonium transporter [Candidatus Eremiobacteraeota bacterium]
MKKPLKILPLIALALLIMKGMSFAEEVPGTTLAALTDVQKYDRALHIMAMLMAGFGFLMVFLKRYGRSALTATYLLVSTAIPLYFVVGAPGRLIDRLILAEFAAASLLICAGAVLGRLKMGQYILLALLFVPFYAFNEKILNGGMGLITGKFIDTGGSIAIHAFGALFGLGVAMAMTTQQESEAPIECDETSERYSLLGSMVLWIFWPSFCSALVAPEAVPRTAVNVIFALCGSTLSTYFASVKLRGKISAADIANAALAGGVAIGSVCDSTVPTYAFEIGIFAGIISTFGFAVIQPRLAARTHKIDTCGVLNLHGLPGIFGGLAAIVLVKGIQSESQLNGILATIFISCIAGLITGKIVSFMGRRKEPYVDSEEFEGA